ncbi:glutathione S-transferase family protein [Burkholderia sp. Ac-20344]|uniref:glutathione S-transferase family protein n=1 Tax=Burkholderia sp. Ac-20344 TaxID=2703890 RepID=UPI00197C3BE7|nr:glutathione S-transferase family protein [Burkholderia sp. Ac-20344]MBN3836065.1 glutathione S-transferase family protein [Burkholderia sp. Ac-20344]
MTAIPSTSLVLYGAATGNSVRAAIALEEAGIPYTARRVNLRHGEQRSEGFLSLNPAGKVPVLVGHREGNAALVISQSSAIMLYAARLGRPALFPEAESSASAIATERFFYIVTDVIAPSHASWFAGQQGFEQMAELHRQRSADAFALCEQFLTATPFLAGDTLTLADIAAVAFARFNEDHIDWEQLPALRAWFEQVVNRPAVQRGLNVFGQ